VPLDHADRAAVLEQHRDRERIGLAAETLIERLAREILANRGAVDHYASKLRHLDS
jgi:hypothetical protein